MLRIPDVLSAFTIRQRAKTLQLENFHSPETVISPDISMEVDMQKTQPDNGLTDLFFSTDPSLICCKFSMMRGKFSCDWILRIFESSCPLFLREST